MATALVTAPSVHSESAPAAPSGSRGPRVGRLCLGLVVVTALATAAGAYGHFRGVHRHLWISGDHDRSAHYLTALKLGLGLRHGDPAGFFTEIVHCNVWPPLHGLLVGLVVAVAGPDYRIAVLPNVLAWAATAVLAFLVARRAAPRAGNLAGLLAALLVLVSPGHRGYATDFMLESLGACLSLAALYAYLVAVQDGSARAGRALAVVLTALFLVKYNYWLLVLFALAAAELTARPRERWQAAVALLRGIDWRAWGVRQLRQPLTYLLAAVLAAVVAILRHGDRPFDFAGRAVSLYPPHNIFHVAYMIVFLRLVLWWRAGGRGWAAGLDTRVRPLVAWHGWAVAVYLLLPRRPSLLLWFLSPGNAPREQAISLRQGLEFYGHVLAAHYHVALWSALAVLALFAVAAALSGRLRPGGRAVLFLALIGAALTVNHPNRQGRYVHSWLAAAWVGAGLGVALLWPRRPSRLAGPRAVLVGAAAAALLAAHLPGLAHNGPAPEGGPRPDEPSWLDVTDACQLDLDAAQRATLLATVEVRFHALWTQMARYGSLAKFEDRWFGFAGGGRDNRQGFLRWLETTSTDTIVLFDRLPDRPGGVELVLANCRAHAEVRDLLMGQQVFRLVKRQEFPRHGCAVLVWQR